MSVLQLRRLHLLLLLTWVLLGTGLRLYNLTAKPLWTDEFATLVFSLGHSFETVPLDQVITAETLLHPLEPEPQLQLGAVIEHLFRESTHPPLYFWLTHLWLHVFAPEQGWGLVWGARSIAVFLGVAAIPAIFGLAYIAFRNIWVAQLSALLMATSPLGIYLAQEARHYTLPTLWVIASLTCLVVASQRHRQHQSLPPWLIFSWISINGLGMASHYFFSLTLIAEGLVVLSLGWHQLWPPFLGQPPRAHPCQPNVDRSRSSFWLPMGLVALGTLITMAVWWPLAQGVQDREITQWANLGSRADWPWYIWLKPVAELLTQPVTILYMLPLPNLISTIVLILLLAGTSYLLYQGLRLPLSVAATDSINVLSGFVLAAWLVFLAVTYGFEREITNATRYYFVFFPAIIILVARALVTLWQQSSPHRRVLPVVMVFSLLGALTVINNWGYQKVHRPDLVAAAIHETLPHPTLISMPHRTHGQTGRLMGIAWQLEHNYSSTSTPLFLLTHQPQTTTPPSLETMASALAALPRPLNLWLVDFRDIKEASIQALLQAQGCTVQPEQSGRVDGYRYRLHRCNVPSDL